MNSLRRLYGEHKDAVLAFALGTALRVFYVRVTPWMLRGHDVGGHVQYLDMILKNWTIPGPHDGFETYQPPLYYYLSAGIVRLREWFHGSLPREVVVQYVSCGLSILTLIVALCCALLLFPDTKQRIERLFFMLLVSVFPSLVFVSARINNDALVQLCMFLAFFLLLLWWRRRGWMTWFWLTIVIGLGLLSKSNMILWVPIAFIVLALAHNRSFKEKIAPCILLVLVPLLIAGWFQVPRFFDESEKRAALVGNVGQMTGPIPSTPDYLLTFNPVQILENPFNHIIGTESRRLYHWEYFFRSAFFGEFEFPGIFAPTAVILLASALLLIPFAAARLVMDLCRIRTSPTSVAAVTSVVLLLGALAYRLELPYSACQDFRFSIALVLPWSAYMVMGLSREKALLQWVHIFLCGVLILWSAIFLAMIAVMAPR